MKIAACYIVKGVDEEAEYLRKSLESIKGHVDGIFLNINYPKGQVLSTVLITIAKNYTDNIIETEWHDDFAEARNANFAQVPDDYEWILWLDTDDTVDKPQKIREVCEVSGKYDSVYVDYEYDHDEQGNPLTVHMVARLIQNNGSHAWKGSIHETLIETRSATQGMTKDFQVIHHADEARTAQSYDRNIRMLETQIESEQKDPDPRTFYYLACTYMDSGINDGAKQLFNDYLTMSGWDQERCVAETKLGRIFLSEGDRAEAKKHFMLAIGEDPDSPDPRVEIGSLELEMNQYRKAQQWLEGVVKMEVHQTTLERNPMTYTFRTYLLLADVYLSLGGKHLEKALEYAEKALKFKRKDKDLKAYVKTIKHVVEDKRLTEKILSIAQVLKKNKEDDKIKTLMEAVPKQLDDNPIIVRLRQDGESFKWPEKSIVIMTGDTALDAWGPWSLKEGIGGSEEAIIRLAPKLAKLGYKVVVFAKPGADAGFYDGVMWRNFWEWNSEDEFDIFVAWRAPFIFEKEIKARKKYLWLHDVMEEGEFGQNRLNDLDKVIVLSKYHRSLFPNIPDEKIMLSANGIDPEDFVKYDGKKKRDPHKLIYASSHVRGLAYLYKIWPDVKKAVPKATLDVYYGRESFDKVHKGNPERMKWMDDMITKAKELEGVTDYGKVSQDKIIEESFKAGIWPYPCPFPETYCITAIKSQAAGAVPVASNFAALDETIQFGHKQEFKEFDEKDLEEYKNALIKWLLYPEKQEAVRKKMMAWARTNSWDKVAESWNLAFQS